MEEFYIVLEIQKSGDTPAVLVTSYKDKNQAYSKMYDILRVAAVSQLPYHAACIIRGSDCFQIEQKAYKHLLQSNEVQSQEG